MRFSTYIPRFPGHKHTHAFDEVAMSVRCALLALGHTVVAFGEGNRAHNIVFGGHLLHHEQIPPNAILYNLEQSTVDWVKRLAGHYSRYTVWDYSATNVRYWQENGIWARHVPIGYVPELSLMGLQRPAFESGRDIDVLFYGMVENRRATVLDQVIRRGLNTVVLQNTFGNQRDSFIQRAKVALNIHAYPHSVFEIVRCSYLWANRVAVLTEPAVDIEEHQHAVCIAPYEGLADMCAKLVHDVAWRHELESRAFEHFTRRPMTEFLKRAIEETFP